MMNEWMDGWMMDEWVVERKTEWMNGWMVEGKTEWMDGWMK